MFQYLEEKMVQYKQDNPDCSAKMQSYEEYENNEASGIHTYYCNSSYETGPGQNLCKRYLDFRKELCCSNICLVF